MMHAEFDPMVLALVEEIQMLLPGRTVQPDWKDVGRPFRHVPCIVIESSYHHHEISLVDGKFEMLVKHKHRKPPLDKFEYTFEMADPNSLDMLFAEIEMTSEHAP